MAITTQTFPPAPGGMNVARAAQEIEDVQARYLQDILLDFPGLARRRGPVTVASGPVALPRKASGLAVTIDPAGNDKYAALTGTNSTGFLTTWSDTLAATVDLTWPHQLPTDPTTAANAFRFHSAVPALQGGTWIGTASDYGAISPQHALAMWRGGNKANYTTGTITLTRGSAAVTGSGTSWLANVAPGMFLFANTDDASAGTFTDTLIGVVLSVNSDTSITLMGGSPYSGGAGRPYTLRSLRGFIPKVTTGRITAATTDATVQGGLTKFASQGLGTGTWNLYRLRDFTWIGRVSSVASDISLTLAANAAINLSDEDYVAIRGDWGANDVSIDIAASVNKTGWLSAIYAERNWYANNGVSFDKTFRLWFSDTNDPEAVDLSDKGNWIPVSSTSDTPEPIRALSPCYNALLVMKDSETFAVYGSSPDSFTAKKLEDDGTLSTMSVQTWGGGAIWAGRNGIYYYNGVQVESLTEGVLGDVWKNSVRTMDTSRFKMWSMMARNHYFLFIEDLDPTISIKKGSVTTTPSHWVVVVNMLSRAVVLHSNLGIRGSIVLPAEQGRGTWFIANDDTAAVGKVYDANALFDSEGVDAHILTPSGAKGPDFFFESKKYNAGDDMRLKRFKQYAMHYLAQGGAIKIGVTLGLNEIAQTLSSDFPASVFSWDDLQAELPNWSSVAAQYGSWSDLIEGVFVPKRARFMKKDQHLAFRLWQQNATMTRVKMGPFHLGFKEMRPARVT